MTKDKPNKMRVLLHTLSTKAHLGTLPTSPDKPDMITKTFSTTHVASSLPKIPSSETDGGTGPGKGSDASGAGNGDGASGSKDGR